MLREKVICALQAIDEKEVYDLDTDHETVMCVNGYEYMVLTDEEADQEFMKAGWRAKKDYRGMLATADGIELEMGEYFIYKL